LQNEKYIREVHIANLLPIPTAPAPVAGTSGFSTPTLLIAPAVNAGEQKRKEKQAHAGDKTFVLQSGAAKPCGRTTVTDNLAGLLRGADLATRLPDSFKVSVLAISLDYSAKQRGTVSVDRNSDIEAATPTKEEIMRVV